MLRRKTCRSRKTHWQGNSLISTGFARGNCSPFFAASPCGEPGGNPKPCRRRLTATHRPGQTGVGAQLALQARRVEEGPCGHGRGGAGRMGTPWEDGDPPSEDGDPPPRRMVTPPPPRTVTPPRRMVTIPQAKWQDGNPPPRGAKWLAKWWAGSVDREYHGDPTPVRTQASGGQELAVARLVQNRSLDS